MGIQNIQVLIHSEPQRIVDMENFIQSRQRKGKTAKEVVTDLERAGYDMHAARGLVMKYWEMEEE